MVTARSHVVSKAIQWSLASALLWAVVDIEHGHTVEPVQFPDTWTDSCLPAGQSRVQLQTLQNSPAAAGPELTAESC